MTGEELFRVRGEEVCKVTGEELSNVRGEELYMRAADAPHRPWSAAACSTAAACWTTCSQTGTPAGAVASLHTIFAW